MNGLGCRWLSRRPDGADVIILGRDGQAMLGGRAFSPLLAEIAYGCCQPVGRADLDAIIFFVPIVPHPQLPTLITRCETKTGARYRPIWHKVLEKAWAFRDGMGTH